jgi:hypothetical protein
MPGEEKVPSKDLLDRLKDKIYIEMKGKDEKVRPLCVGLQAKLEESLAEQLESLEVEAVLMVTHTEFPPPPLRVKIGKDGFLTETPQGVVTPEIIFDENRFDTVRKQARTLRRCLEAGCKLVAVYEQKDQIPGNIIFQDARRQYPDSLIAHPIQAKVEEKYSGATYLIRDLKGNITCFSIFATQASAPKPGGMKLWFGSLEHEQVKTRFEQINGFLKEQGIYAMSDFVEQSKQPSYVMNPDMEREPVKCCMIL